MLLNSIVTGPSGSGGLFDFFRSISNSIILFFESIGMYVKGFFTMANITSDSGDFIDIYLGWLPSPVYAIIITVFSVVVIYKILGREG